MPSESTISTTSSEPLAEISTTAPGVSTESGPQAETSGGIESAAVTVGRAATCACGLPTPALIPPGLAAFSAICSAGGVVLVVDPSGSLPPQLAIGTARA